MGDWYRESPDSRWRVVRSIVRQHDVFQLFGPRQEDTRGGAIYPLHSGPYVSKSEAIAAADRADAGEEQHE